MTTTLKCDWIKRVVTLVRYE